MTPALYSRAKEVFLELCDLPAQEQARGLVERCGGDQELVAAVSELLDGDARPLSLERAGEGVRDHLQGLLAEREEALPRIPGTTVLERLGEGGMGTVYRAEQTEPVRRVVALKLMRSSLQGTRPEDHRLRGGAGRRDSWRRRGDADGGGVPAPTSTRSASCCTSCSAARCPTPAPARSRT